MTKAALADLISDSRTSLTDAHRDLINIRGFNSDTRHLTNFRFWNEATPGSPRLWEHQKAAILTAIAYWNGDKSVPERPEHQEAGLMKLPTGTGKSGIISVISRCLLNVRRVLVLTPRTALADQLIADIRYRFWNHLGYETEDRGLFVANADELGAPLEKVYTEVFLPRHVPQMVEHLENKSLDRAILVGTHQALGDIRQTALNSDLPVAATYHRLLIGIKKTFDLLIVDEGHYEPAISWSEGVRNFNVPTLLFSATPYRNDYKSFHVFGRYLFNYPYAKAVDDRIIRPVEIILPHPVANKGGNSAVAQFVQMLHDQLPARIKQAACWFSESTAPKVMVRGDDLATLEALQIAIDRAFGTQSVLIHHRAKKTVENKNRFTSVASAMQAREDAQFWIHQNKLMEGIDNSSFVAVAIFDLMGNARQLVQQIGRATRYSKTDNQINQVAWVLSSPTNAAHISRSWDRYKGYEDYAAKNLSYLVSNEVALPDRLLERMPEYQYIDGEFRARFQPGASLGRKDIQLPRSAIVLKIVKPLRDMGLFGKVIEEKIMDQERFKVTPIAGLPENMRGFSYYAWRNSPFLIRSFFSEWKLGIFISIQEGEFLFMHDTEGLVIDMDANNLKKASRAEMEKAFPLQDEVNKTRLSRMSFSSLDMSQHAIRGLAVKTRSFEEVFTDLLDPFLVPSTAMGFINGTARYVGFNRSRVRDSSERYVPIDEYASWISQIAQELGSAERVRNSVFSRYAQVVERLSTDEAQPLSILLDPSQDSFTEMHEDASKDGLNQKDLDYLDLCSDIDPVSGDFTITVGEKEVLCSIEYEESRGKYLLTSEGLNALFPTQERENRRANQTLVQRLNQSQAFRIFVRREDVVYSEGSFYQPLLRWKTNGNKPILDHIYASEALKIVDSEKGEEYYGVNQDDWYSKSIFGIFSAAGEEKSLEHGLADDLLVSAITEYPVWLCDDDGQETSDFIGFDMLNKKIVFVHAKIGDQGAKGRGFNVGGLQEVGRQALASLSFISMSQPSVYWTEKRWHSDVQANEIKLPGRSRIFKNLHGVATVALNDMLCTACRNPSFNKEIWIVGGKMASRSALSKGLDANPRKNRLRQFLMHWDAMQTACARANVRLKFFCA